MKKLLVVFVYSLILFNVPSPAFGVGLCDFHLSFVSKILPPSDVLGQIEQAVPNESQKPHDSHLPSPRWDLSTFAKFLYSLDSIRIEELKSPQKIHYFKFHKSKAAKNDWRYELVLLALKDKKTWMDWIDDLVKKGKVEHEIRAVAPFSRRLPNDIKEYILASFKKNWPSLRKENRETGEMGSRRSVELFYAYMVSPNHFFEFESPWFAYELFLNQVQVDLGTRIFHPQKIIATIKEIHDYVKPYLTEDSLILFGSYINGKASMNSDIDYRTRNFPTMSWSQALPPTPTMLTKQILRVLGDVPEFSHHYYSKKEEAVRFGLRKNWIVIELTKDQIFFHLSPYFDPYRTSSEADMTSYESLSISK